MTAAPGPLIAAHSDPAPRRSGPVRSAAGLVTSAAAHVLCLTAAIAALEAGAGRPPRPPQRPFTFVMVTRELPRVPVPVRAPVPDAVAPEPVEASPLDAPAPAPEPPGAEPVTVADVVDAGPPPPVALPDPPPAPAPGAAFAPAVAVRAPVEAGAAGPVLGAFDRREAPAPDTGHGTAAGVVASGFAAAAPPAARPGPGSAVAAGGFDRARPRPAPPAVRRVAASETPVEIVFKPAPSYTDEARELGIEGEVVLEVEFAASNDVRVLRVVRGLGHGLDEAAARAAGRIRFKPAERDGRAVDRRATVHIVFRLSSQS